MSTEMEMPRYVCHKHVWALKIKAIDGNFLVPEDSRYAPLDMCRQWLDKHKPEAGGYYVVYKDGYASFSPAQAFEEGYTLVS